MVDVADVTAAAGGVDVAVAVGAAVEAVLDVLDVLDAAVVVDAPAADVFAA